MGKEKIEYMCSFCGKRIVMPSEMGRPQPGKCPKKQGDKPHSWKKNKVIPVNSFVL